MTFCIGENSSCLFGGQIQIILYVTNELLKLLEFEDVEMYPICILF